MYFTRLSVVWVYTAVAGSPQNPKCKYIVSGGYIVRTYSINASSSLSESRDILSGNDTIFIEFSNSGHCWYMNFKWVTFNGLLGELVMGIQKIIFWYCILYKI